MKTEDLIVELAHGVAPVTPLAPPAARLARWSALAVAVCAIAILAIGPRAHFIASLGEASYAVSLAILVAASVMAAAVTLRLSVPGAETSPTLRALVVVLMVAWPAIWLAELVKSGKPIRAVVIVRFHWACATEIAVIAGLTAWALVVMSRLAAPLRPAWTATLASLAAIAIGAAATQVICPLDDPAHQLAVHVAPGAIVAIAIATLGARALRTNGLKKV